MELKTVTLDLLAALSDKAAASPRRRANHNLHPELDDPVQRFLNAVEPGTYVRPHRHIDPVPKWEVFVALAGRIAILVFDDAGRVTERVEVSAAGPVRAVEIPAGAWHALVGPTGEANAYAVLPREAVLCLAEADDDRLVQLAAVLAAGGRAVWPMHAEPLWSRLPAEVGTAAVYHFVDGMTYDEVAEALGCSRRKVGYLLEAAQRSAAADLVLAEQPA